MHNGTPRPRATTTGVGAGSQIAEGIWQVVNDASLYVMSEAELNEFLTEFGIQQSILSQFSNVTKDVKSPDDFLRLYQLLVMELDSRNEALFRTGCYMRDEGYGVTDVVAVLAPIHGNQQPTRQHKTETYAQHSAEAQRTSQSVFSKPPRPRKEQTTKQSDASYLPNTLREASLKEQGGTAFLRVYEGLLLAGRSAGDVASERNFGVVAIPTQSMLIQLDEPANEIALFPKVTTKAEGSKKSDKRPKQSERFYRKPLEDASDDWHRKFIWEQGICKKLKRDN